MKENTSEIPDIIHGTQSNQAINQIQKYSVMP